MAKVRRREISDCIAKGIPVSKLLGSMSNATKSRVGAGHARDRCRRHGRLLQEGRLVRLASVVVFQRPATAPGP